MDVSTLFAIASTEPIVTAEKYMDNKKKNGHFSEFIPPKIILVCYQQSTLQHLLEYNQKCKHLAHLQSISDGEWSCWNPWRVGEWSPALAIKMEEFFIFL